MLDHHDPGRSRVPADDDVATHVDGEALIATENGGRRVGRVALGAAAKVEAHSGRPANRSLGDRHLLPFRDLPRTRGAARRCLQQRLAQFGGLDAHARAGVAGTLQLFEEAGIDQAVRQLGSVEGCPQSTREDF